MKHGFVMSRPCSFRCASYSILRPLTERPGTALATGLITGTQEATPSPVLGRVVSLIQVADALGQGAGILAAGLLSSLVSLTVLLNAQASCYLTCAIVAMVGFARKPPDPSAYVKAVAPLGRAHHHAGDRAYRQ
jgi:hypothetical protein